MMNIRDMQFTRWALFLVGLLASLLLASCGESTNLADPKEIASTTDCSELAAADDSVTCIPGYFVDEAVENLNYTCGKVSSVTNVAGGFSCPVGSKVEFSIINPDDASATAKKIVLGEFNIKSLPKIYSTDAALYITPMDFGSASAVNIVRLLQTLREPDGVADELPSRTIKLLDEDKKKLNNLSSSITASNFTLDSATFKGLLDSYLASLPRTMIDVSKAEYFLKKGIHSTVAGAYSVPGFIATRGYDPVGEVSDGDVGGIRGISSTDYFLAATWNLVDRKGRITGFGVYSTGSSTATSDVCKTMFPGTSCSPKPALNVLRQDNSAGLYWTPWDTNAGSWALSYKLLDSTDHSTAYTFSFVQGAIDRGAVAGSPYLYAAIFGESVNADSSRLGRWQLIGNPDFTDPQQTSYTIARTRNVAPTLDPVFWDPAKFPLKVRMSFLKGDKASTIGILRVLILEDGNIVSNLQGRCGAGLDRDTLSYSDGSKEFPLGTVAQIFSANNDGGKRRYIAPIMLIPDDPAFTDLRNIQIGIADGQAASARLRVDTQSATAYLKIYSDTEFDSAGNARDQDTSAQWGNAVGVFRTLSTGNAGYVTSQPDSACP